LCLYLAKALSLIFAGKAVSLLKSGVPGRCSAWQALASFANIMFGSKGLPGTNTKVFH
jgi:hypothetical protein